MSIEVSLFTGNPPDNNACGRLQGRASRCVDTEKVGVSGSPSHEFKELRRRAVLREGVKLLPGKRRVEQRDAANKNILVNPCSFDQQYDSRI